MENYIDSENGNGEELFEGKIMWWHDNDEIMWFPLGKRPRITIEGIVSIPCSDGRGFHKEMFPRGKAFLCLIEDLPFKKSGSIEFINTFCLIGDPKNQFLNWCFYPLEDDGDGWNEADIFSDTREEAVENKIRDIENMAKKESLCKYCKKKELCIANLRSLIRESIKTESQKDTSCVIQSLIQ